MISVGTVSLEVEDAVECTEDRAEAAAIRKGTMTGPFHPLSTSTFVVT